MINHVVMFDHDWMLKLHEISLQQPQFIDKKKKIEQ